MADLINYHLKQVIVRRGSASPASAAAVGACSASLSALPRAVTPCERWLMKWRQKWRLTFVG
jgi:hypothetical protein